jgi:GDPmannose 4,6-dehydratase
MKRRALISGITGQDGSYLAEFLLEKDYKVFGLIRRTSVDSNTERIHHILNDIELIEGDLVDQNSLNRAVQTSQPNEVYNMAAMSFVPTSWKEPELTAKVTGLGALKLLEAIRTNRPDARYYQSSSSEQFGNAPAPQSELTPFSPRSPYACSKVFAHFTTLNYSESFNIFGSCGILFNHESPRRSMEFVTKKIANAVARIYYGKQKNVLLGDLSPKRDFGYAKDYMEYIWKILQLDKPGVFVIGSGETHSIKEFADIAFMTVGLLYEDYVVYDPKFTRPAEVFVLQADNTKAKKELGFEIKTPFKELVEIMVKAELERER